METIAKYGKEVTDRSDKNTHQVIMIKRYETINLTSLNATYLQ
jgi:hypothetical protein